MAEDIIQTSAATGNATTGFNATEVGYGRYNATALSYAEGLAQKNELLLGNVTMTVAPMGTITATVPRHSVAMFRLRAVPTVA